MTQPAYQQYDQQPQAQDNNPSNHPPSIPNPPPKPTFQQPNHFPNVPQHQYTSIAYYN